jgi:hypothetical protein
MTTIGSVHPREMSGGLPEGFHRSASDVYRRMAIDKDAPAPPSTENVAKTLLKESGS